MDNAFFTQSDLILLCIRNVEEAKEDCTFERLVYECFASFPDKFSFYTYKLPDSLKLDRQIRSLRQQGLIVGNNRSSFQLTDKGCKRVLQISSQPSDSIKMETFRRKAFQLKGGRKEQLLIDRITSSLLFGQYEDGTYLKPTIDELRLLFFGTLETSTRDLIENMEYCRKIAQKAGNEKVIRFIAFYKKYLKKGLRKQLNEIR